MHRLVLKRSRALVQTLDTEWEKWRCGREQTLASEVEDGVERQGKFISRNWQEKDPVPVIGRGRRY